MSGASSITVSYLIHRVMRLITRQRPGRPLPQGEGQEGSPALLAFHKAKSRPLFFSEFTKLVSPAAAKAVDPPAHGLSLG